MGTSVFLSNENDDTRHVILVRIALQVRTSRYLYVSCKIICDIVYQVFVAGDSSSPRFIVEIIRINAVEGGA